MAQSTTADNGGRSLAIFIVVGLVFVGLFFGGAWLLKQRNAEVATTNTGQDQPAENNDPEQNDDQPAPPAEEEQPTTPAQPQQPDELPNTDAPATPETEDPDQVATTGPSDDTIPPVTATSDENLPATGPAEDLAFMVGTMTLIAFGIHRLRQSKLAMMPRA